MIRLVVVLVAFAACADGQDVAIDAAMTVDAAIDAVPCPGGCDDNNPCTADTCVDNACVHPPGGIGLECRTSTAACDPAEECDGASSACPTDQTTCCLSGLVMCTDGSCINQLDWCNGTMECADNSDEGTTCGGTCSPTAMPCASGACVVMSTRCDGIPTCADRSDESAATCGGNCVNTAIACSDGSCIPTTYVCDGFPDCPGGTDEAGC